MAVPLIFLMSNPRVAEKAAVLKSADFPMIIASAMNSGFRF
jgi:hypothetical protein